MNITIVVSNRGMRSESFDVTCYFYPTIIGTQRVEDLPIGCNKTLKFLWDTSTVEPGVYFIKAFADSSRAITEYDEENNNCTAITPVTVVAPPGILDVDKALSRVVSGPSPAVVGRETVYEILIVVSNVGGSEITNVNVTDTIEEGEISGVGSPSQGSIRSWNSMGIDWDVGNLGVG